MFMAWWEESLILTTRISPLLEKIKTSSPDIIDSINSSGKLDEEIEKKLISIIEEFKKNK